MRFFKVSHLGRWLALVVLSIFLAVSSGRGAFAAEPGRHLYLLSKPVPTDVRIGTVGKILHYVWWATEVSLKTGVAYAASHHSLAPTAGYFVFEAATSLPYVTPHTMADLTIRQYLQTNKLMRKLQAIPEARRAILINSGQFSFSGPLASSRAGRSFVFLETDAPLKAGEAVAEGMGEPIDVTDSTATRVRFRLSLDDESGEAVWDAPLTDVLAGKPIPSDVADQWRDRLKAFDEASKRWSPEAAAAVPWLADKLPSADYILKKHNRLVRIDAELALPTGETVPIDAMISGSQVRRLLGITWWQKVRDFFADLVGRGELGENAVKLRTKSFPDRCEALLTGEDP